MSRGSSRPSVQTVLENVTSLQALDTKQCVCFTGLLTGNWINVRLKFGAEIRDWGYAPLYSIYRNDHFLSHEEAKRLVENPNTFVPRHTTFMKRERFRAALPDFADFDWSPDKLWTMPTREFPLSQIERKVKERLQMYMQSTLHEKQVLVKTEDDLMLETIARLLIFTNSEIGDKQTWQKESAVLRRQLETCYSMNSVKHWRGYCHAPFEQSVDLMYKRECVLYGGTAFFNVNQAYYLMRASTYKIPDILTMTQVPLQLRAISAFIKNTLYAPIVTQTEFDMPPCVSLMTRPGVLNSRKSSAKYVNNEGRWMLITYLIKTGRSPVDVKRLFDHRANIVYETESDRRSHQKETEVAIARALKSTRQQGCTAMQKWCPFYVDNVTQAQLRCGHTVSPYQYKKKPSGAMAR